MTSIKPAPWPRDYARFEALPCIHSILKGARDGVEGVGILTRYDWLPEGVDSGRSSTGCQSPWVGTDTWGDTWIEARANWIREVAPLLLPAPRSGYF
jgi:hypothetical protein